MIERMNKMLNDLDIKQHIEFCNLSIQSTKRNRNIVSIMALASIIVFSNIFFARPDSWPKQRSKNFNRVMSLVSAYEKDRADEVIKNRHYEVLEVDPEHSKELIYRKALEYQLRKPSFRAEKQDYEKAINYVYNAYFGGVTFINKSTFVYLTEFYERERISETMMVKVSFLGVVYDINDLTLICSVTFLIIYLWGLYGLFREYDNNKKVFRIIEGLEDTKALYLYRYFSQAQLWTIPPGKRMRFVFIWIPRVVYMLPVGLLGYAIFSDLTTLEVAKSLGFDPESNIVLEVVLAGVVATIAVYSIMIEVEIDGQWKLLFEGKIKELRAKDQTPINGHDSWPLRIMTKKEPNN